MNVDMKKTYKEELLELLAQEDTMVLSQAYLYAKQLILCGVDVAEKWSTVTQHTEALQKAYAKGVYDEASRREKLHHELMESEYMRGRYDEHMIMTGQYKESWFNHKNNEGHDEDSN